MSVSARWLSGVCARCEVPLAGREDAQPMFAGVGDVLLCG